MSHSITLNDWPSAHATLVKVAEWIKGRTIQGRAVTLTVKEQRRTIPQNSHIHPVVTRIAKALGRPTDDESLRVLRRLLVEQWQHETRRRAREPSVEDASLGAEPASHPPDARASRPAIERDGDAEAFVAIGHRRGVVGVEDPVERALALRQRGGDECRQRLAASHCELLATAVDHCCLLLVTASRGYGGCRPR